MSADLESQQVHLLARYDRNQARAARRKAYISREKSRVRAERAALERAVTVPVGTVVRPGRGENDAAFLEEQRALVECERSFARLNEPGSLLW